MFVPGSEDRVSRRWNFFTYILDLHTHWRGLKTGVRVKGSQCSSNSVPEIVPSAWNTHTNKHTKKHGTSSWSTNNPKRLLFAIWWPVNRNVPHTMMAGVYSTCPCYVAGKGLEEDNLFVVSSIIFSSPSACSSAPACFKRSQQLQMPVRLFMEAECNLWTE